MSDVARGQHGIVVKEINKEALHGHYTFTLHQGGEYVSH